jgi:hypothetical protein
VQQIANDLADEHGGKIPDVSLLDIRIKQRLDEEPDLIDRDRYSLDCRKFWERANNQVISAKAGPNLFVPGAYVTLGKRAKGRMRSLNPVTDVAAWLDKDSDSKANFNRTIDRRIGYCQQILAEASVHPDCRTLGELESKLRGYVPSPLDDTIFDEDVDIDE